MALHESEREQIEAIQRWWRENGRSVLVGVVAALALVVGWQQWQSYQERQAEAASAGYQAFLSVLDRGDSDAAAARAEALRSEYPGSAYAVMAAMEIAASRAENGELEAAAGDLQWALDHADTDAMKQMARLRLARLRLAMDDPAGALSALEPVPEGAYAAAFQEVRGDALAATGEAAAALQAYDAALAAADLPAGWREMIRMKRDTLASGARLPAS